MLKQMYKLTSQVIQKKEWLCVKKGEKSNYKGGGIWVCDRE